MSDNINRSRVERMMFMQKQDQTTQREQKKGDQTHYTAMGFIVGFLTIAVIAAIIHFL